MQNNGKHLTGFEPAMQWIAYQAGQRLRPFSQPTLCVRTANCSLIIGIDVSLRYIGSIFFECSIQSKSSVCYQTTKITQPSL